MAVGKLYSIGDLRECVDAAELLRERIRLLGPTCSPDRRAAIWAAFDYHMELAEEMLKELRVVFRKGRRAIWPTSRALPLSRPRAPDRSQASSFVHVRGLEYDE